MGEPFGEPPGKRFFYTERTDRAARRNIHGDKWHFIGKPAASRVDVSRLTQGLRTGSFGEYDAPVTGETGGYGVTRLYFPLPSVL